MLPKLLTRRPTEPPLNAAHRQHRKDDPDPGQGGSDARTEGRISVAKRRHGLNRCRYKGDNGMKRWVGLGVIADNLINIGRAMAQQTARAEETAP
jgi:hypothetical protein